MENYRIVDFVNSGAYGSVHKAQCLKTGRPVALKVVHVTPDTRECAETEVVLSTRLRHPNIIHTHDMFELDGNYVLVQELAESDLFEFINERGFGCNEAALKAVFSQMAAGVAYMHENGVSHRDLKPENVLLMGDGTAKIIDFGLSEESRYVRGRVGTDPYCAPEVVRLPAVKKNKRRGRRVDGFAADVFSLGLTLVAMVTGRLPWAIADDAADQDYADFVSRLLTYDVEGAVFAHDPAELGVTAHLCALLDHMLHPDPRQRATIHDVLAALRLPWFDNDLHENNVSNTGALASPVTNGKAGDLDSGVSAGACSAADVSVDMGERGLACYGEYEDDDEALGDELPPLPAFLVSH